ncbi:hypothetical protein PHYPSEUDO_003605 [Phytophthora pseudosyringae]|uniref:BZIP domain-containing protein n=1 Tax=Phytophthora pseudosyringae TaxID=221518 RepID=A0A8T1VQ70_9STRA|nr:hypothetical protein PHYPSEUDO_003605 [Phytophthora pseudosyringae]
MSSFLFQPCPQIRSNDEQDSAKRAGQRATMKASHARQQRYRERQRQYVDQLEATVKRLRMDVDQHLIARHNAQKVQSPDNLLGMPTRPSMVTASNVVTIMTGCMKAFESGVQVQQRRFLESAMRSDVHFGCHVGRDSILEQWMYFLLYFNDAAPTLEHCEVSVDFLEKDYAAGSIGVTLVVRLTRRSLATFFPHTLASKRLRDKLLQKSVLRLPMSVFFQFDEQGKVSRYDPTIDFVTGLYAVLQDYRDVASTLESANIDSLGQIRGDLSPAATSHLGVSFHCDRRSHNHAEMEHDGSRSTARLDKLSVSFLLSSGEGMRHTDSDGQSAT